jgi:hypothetical protein
MVASAGNHHLSLRYAALADLQVSRTLSRLPSAIEVLGDGLAGLDPFEDAGWPEPLAVAMEWISGPTLLQGLDRASRTGNVGVIRALSAALVQTWNDLQAIEFVHGDLTAQNLLVRANGQLACIDLDTATWDDAPFGPSGEGTPGYRHPVHWRDATVRDAFAALVMITSMAVLADAPDLRVHHGDGPLAMDGTILFSAWDLADPAASRVFAEAHARVTPPGRTLLEALEQACIGDTQDILEACEALPRLRMPSGGRLHPAPAAGGWDVGPVVERMRAHYADTWDTPLDDTRPMSAASVDAAPASAPPGAAWSPGMSDVHQAVTGADLSELKAAISRSDEAEVVRIWSQVSHDPIAGLLAADVETVLSAGYDRRVLAESRRKRDGAVVTIATEAERRQIPLGQPARAVVRQARERALVRAELDAALAEDNRPRLAELAVSGQLVVLGDADRQSLQRVLQAIEWPALQRAIDTDDDILIAAAFDDELFDHAMVGYEEVLDRVDLARRRVQWLGQARAALAKRDSTKLRDLLIDPPAGAPERLSAPERRRIRRSIEQRHALAGLDTALRDKDDAAIVVSLNRVERVGARISDRATWARVQQVVERVSLIDELLLAAEAQPLDHARIAQLIPALKTLGLERDPRLGDEGLVERLEEHVIRMAHVRRIRAAISRDNDVAIVTAAVPDPRNALDMLTEHERDRVAVAIRARRNADRSRP